MDTPDIDTRGYRHPEAPWGGWQDVMVTAIHNEIDKGMIVQVVLPGAERAVVVEEAGTWQSMVVLADPLGHRYYVGSMAGIVILAHPTEGRGTGLWEPDAPPYVGMNVDPCPPKVDRP